MCNCSGLNSCEECCRSLEVLQGLDGEDGINGNGITTGTGAPSDTLDETFIIYVDRNAPFNIYFRENNVWVLRGQLQGVDGNGFLIQSTVEISSAEILQLFSAPKRLINNPPAGYFLHLVEAVGSVGAGTGYGGVGQVVIRYNPTYWAAQFNGGFLTSPSIVSLPTYIVGINMPTGLGLELSSETGNPTGGTATLKIMLTYHLWLL